MPAAPPAPASLTTAAADELIPLRGRRRAIAQTLTRQWQTVPHVIDYREVDGSALVAARDALRVGASPESARALTLTSLLVKIAATALSWHPDVNAAVDLENEEITRYAARDIGIATATPDGLVVPVVRGADRLSVVELGAEIAALGAAARARKLTREQLSGGTFTLNNYGGLGIWLGTPIIAPGQAANLGVGRMEERAVVRGGQVVVRPIIPLACSGDHRLLDGDTLAAFVSDVVRLIEAPLRLLGELR